VIIMNWQTILKENKPKFNMDGHDHMDILLDLKTLLRNEIGKAEKEFEEFIDDMNKNNDFSGAAPLSIGEVVDVGVKAFDKIIADTESSIDEAMTSITDSFKKHFDMTSPMSDGEEQADYESDRQQDAQREQMAERHYSDEQDSNDYWE